MHRAKVDAEITLAYIPLKSGCIQHKPKCTKNAGTRLVVPKAVEHTKLKLYRDGRPMAAILF